MKIRDGRKLTLQQKELIRNQAVSLVVDQNMSRRRVAEILGVSYYSLTLRTFQFSQSQKFFHSCLISF